MAAAALPLMIGSSIASMGVQYAAGQNQADAAYNQGQAALASGRATADAATYQAQVAANNATIAKQNADYTIAAGSRKAADVSMKGAEDVAKVRNTMATNGVDVNTGSAVNVQQSAREIEKIDTETAMNNSQLQAYGYRTQATNFEAESELEKKKAAGALVGADYAARGADYAATGAELNADAGMLSTASSLGSKWATGGVGFGSGTG